MSQKNKIAKCLHDAKAELNQVIYKVTSYKSKRKKGASVKLLKITLKLFSGDPLEFLLPI